MTVLPRSVRGWSWLAWALVALAAAAAEAPPPSRPPSPVCYGCFWQYQEPVFRDELVRFYRDYRTDDPLLHADVSYLLARVENDPSRLCRALELFEPLASSAEAEPSRRLLAAETVAFGSAECDRETGPWFARAAEAASLVGDTFKASVYRAVAAGTFRPRFGEAEIVTRWAVPREVRAYVLGESKILVEPGSKIGVQVERTVRDWISYQMRYDFAARPVRPEAILSYHEGARLREIVAAAKVEVVALSGVLAARSGDRWLAADESGTFRYEVLPDKIQYPTTRAAGDLALLVDTHGISSLVAPALREKVNLVIGCGDHPEKMKAAFHLARAGVDVYFPCDRFVGEVLGYDAPGTLIGSAPVRSSPAGAVIGDRPVTFRTDETVVVETTDQRGVLQYYDAPARYFRRLAEHLPLRLDVVAIDGAGQASRVTARAVAVGASAIGVRVWNPDDYAAVRAWLAGSPARRAVLFHTAPYPEGVRLFDEFPGRTTFGDPRPRFLVEVAD